MSSSTYTPNIGVEQPATGMYPNTWGVVANRSYAVIDAAIGGSAQITLVSEPGSPYMLTTGQGTSPSDALYPLLVWADPANQLTGTGFVTIGPTTEQRLYVMSNTTAVPVQFQQGAGATFLLQPGYAAQIYCDGAGPNANVAAAIANPQFNNVLVQGNLQVAGSLTSSGGGTLNLGTANISWLGLGVPSPTSIPDPLTVYGLGSGGQIRLMSGVSPNFGFILRNDGSNFYMVATNVGDPYGPAYGPIPFAMNLSSGVIGVGGWTPNANYALSAPTAHLGSLAVDGSVTVQALAATLTITGVTVQGGTVIATGQMMVDSGQNNNASAVDLAFGALTEGISSTRVAGYPNYLGLTFSTAGHARLTITNAGQFGMNYYPPDQPSHALCVGGIIHTTMGIVFPDGTLQQTAYTGSVPSPFTNFAPLGMTLNAVYQNAHATPMLVTACVYLAAGTSCYAYIGGNPPSTEVGYGSSGPTWSTMVTFAFVVQPGQFYSLSTINSGLNIFSSSGWW